MSGRVRPGRILHVFLKEVREARRERNLWINVVLIPLFLYPALGFAGFQVFLMIRGMSEREVTRIAVDPRVPTALADSLAAEEQVEIVTLPPGLRGEDDRAEAAAFRRVRAATADSTGREIQAALLWNEAGDSTSAGPVATVIHDRSRQRSEDARAKILTAIDGWKRARTLAAMQAVGLGEKDLDVWNVEAVDEASAEARGRQLLSMLLPLILILMLGQGTFYSALDTIVGERERGTWETLLTTPLVRGEALLGKFLFVVAASLLALALNLGSLTLFSGFVFRLLGKEAGEQISVTVSWGAVGLILLTALLTAALVSAVLMILAAPARTYREGQAMLMPAYLAMLVPGFVVVIGRDPFSLRQAGVPVLNSVALFKSVLRGDFPPGPILVTLLVLAAASAAALGIASRLVDREEVWFDPAFSLRRMLAGRRARSTGGGR